MPMAPKAWRTSEGGRVWLRSAARWLDLPGMRHAWRLPLRPKPVKRARAGRGAVRRPSLSGVRIAHLSDLHLLSLEGAVPFRLFNKRLTGYANLRLSRNAKHKPFAVRAAAKAIRALDVDHVVITGDLSNLALEREFELVQRFLDEDLAMRPDQVSLVPGNHDVYTRGAFRTKRFLEYFEPYLRSDLPDLAVLGNAGAFPFVQLRGAVAFIGLSTAVPRLPFVASGQLGKAQLDALARVLDHPEVRRRTPVILQHHPLHNPASFAKTALEGLLDAGEELRLLAPSPVASSSTAISTVASTVATPRPEATSTPSEPRAPPPARGPRCAHGRLQPLRDRRGWRHRSNDVASPGDRR